MNSKTIASQFLLKNLVCCVYILLFSNLKIFAQEAEVKPSKKDNKFINKFALVLNGFTMGTGTRVFPYASLSDWFDPYAGLKLGHPAFLNSVDKMYHHFKFAGFRDYSWKYRYLANSLSSENTKFSFLFKRKTDLDPFFYGIGNSTSKSERIAAKYASIFFGVEIKRNISDGLVLRWSPGFWKFRSGLVGGGEFEKASDAQYLSSRFTFSDRQSIDYWKATLEQWSAFVEIAVPINTSVSTYARFNLKTVTLFPLFKNTKLGVGSRFEWLVSPNRELVPYFAISEAGSKSGLRGFSRERFRNYTLAVLNFEFSFPLSNNFDGFLLSDIAQTALNPTKLPGKKIHAAFGFGFRIGNFSYPLEFGVATSAEGWKLFSSIAVGSPW